jgi:hypothetical protein
MNTLFRVPSQFYSTLTISVAAVALTGCAVTETSRSTTVVRIPSPVSQVVVQAPVPAAVVGQTGLSIGDVVAMIKSQRPNTEIVAAIQQQGMRAALTASDIDLLLANGASRDVVDALLQSRTVVAGPVVSAPQAQNTTSTTVIQTLPAPVIVPRVTYGWGGGWGGGYWGGSSWHGAGWGGRPWGWGPPRVYSPPVVVAPPVFVSPHPVAPPVHGGGNFGRFNVPSNPSPSMGSGFRGYSSGATPGGSGPRRLSKD